MSERVKVCHMTSAHTSNDVRIFQKECRSLAAAGYKVYLVAPGESREESGVNVAGVGEKPKKRLRRMTSFARRVYRQALSLDCDVYHFHDPELLPYGLKLKRRGKAVIFDSHEDYVLQIAVKEYLPAVVRKTVSFLYGKYEAHVVSRIDAVVIPCTIEGKNIFEGVAKKTCFIANYPMPEVLDLYDPQAKKEDYICYVGGLSYERGTAHLIKAAHLAKTRLVLAGKFSPPEFEGELRALPEFDSVDYRGFVTMQEVTDINAHAMAGICTLLHSGQYDKGDILATKVYEYMAMGLPVIVGEYPYARVLLEQYLFGICVDPADPQAIAGVIVYLREHPDEARRMGENGRRAVEQKFNWGAEAKRLLELYVSLIA